MRCLQFAVLAATVFGVASTATAADMTVKAPVSAPASVNNWTGWYAGLNAGGDWGTSNSSMSADPDVGGFFGGCQLFSCDVNIEDVARAGQQRFRTSGFSGGVQGGYNWQSGNLLLGIETDFDYFRSTGSGTNSVPLASGEVTTLGSPGGDAWGPDLVGVFVGSEGMFGIATRITVRLLPLARSVRTMLADFDSLRRAGGAVSAVIASGLVPAALEMMDQSCVQVVEASIYAAGYPTDAAAVLLVELDGSAESAVAAEACSCQQEVLIERRTNPVDTEIPGRTPGIFVWSNSRLRT